MKIKIATNPIFIGIFLIAVAAHAGNMDSNRACGNSFVGYSMIATKVKANLASDKTDDLAHIKVNTDNKGAVLLSGNARNRKEADKAISIARATEGVTSVTSIIQIQKEMFRLIVKAGYAPGANSFNA
jgi:hypothetical protein